MNNRALAGMLEEARMSRKGLALRVNQLGSQYGLSLGYSHTSVARWLAGSTPRGQVPSLICEVLSAKLGRVVKAHEVGFAEASPGLLALDTQPDYLPSADELLVRRLQEVNYPSPTPRRDFLLGAASFSSDLYMRPLLGWLMSPKEEVEVRAQGPKVGEDSVARLLLQIDGIRTMDSQLGGGSLPGDMAKLCLSNEAIPALRSSYSKNVGVRLFSATAELARLAAWTSLDSGHHRASQVFSSKHSSWPEQPAISSSALSCWDRHRMAQYPQETSRRRSI